jgi:hypothetical protein
MKYCQGPKCHEYHTKDRIRGHKGDKHYETRKRSSFYYLNGNACSMICQNDWFSKFGEMALDRFGRIHEPKRQDASGAWYKDYVWRHDGHLHYFVNDLLGECRPITEQQYNNTAIDNPTHLD